MAEEVGDDGTGGSPATGTTATVSVLLVDDERDLADVAALHLERRRDPFDVTVVTTGESALDVVGNDDVDCVVSDYEMPGMDGLDLLRAVREIDPSVPFILYTGRGSEEIASEAISAGVTDYLQKRATTDQYDVLANRVENAVARRRSERARRETELRYQRLVEASPHAILVHYGEDVVYANGTMVELLGLDDRSDIYRSDPLSFVHPDDRDRIQDRMGRIVGGDRSAGWVAWRLVRDDGEVRHVESRGSPIVYDGKQAVLGVIRDVTEQRGHEQRLAALNEATRELLTADSADAVARTTVEVAADVLDEPFVGVFEHDGGALVPVAATEAASDRTRVSRTDLDSLALSEGTVELTAFEAGEPRLVEDYGARQDTLTDVFETVFLFPLGDHGLLSIAATETDSFERIDRDLLEILGQSVVAALDRLDDE
ncbi:response regulator [Haloarcula litorea]|uniref:response regulator n=1 Tax=Haloarcula litorea TaxID=3032579 RepID=UPI0023E85CC7|nr:response regulator [Halomicroarcula sp. GDY20]